MAAQFGQRAVVGHGPRDVQHGAAAGRCGAKRRQVGGGVVERPGGAVVGGGGGDGLLRFWDAETGRGDDLDRKPNGKGPSR